MVGLVSCYKETSFKTTYVLRVAEQVESSGDFAPLAMTKGYAFEGTTDELEFLSYDDAQAGIITSIETGVPKGPFASSQPYMGSESNISFELDRENVVLVVVDPASKTYAYSDYTVPINLAEVFVDIIFRTWKTSTYKASTWTFVVPEVEPDIVVE